MADFYNLVNARIERSGRNKKDKEKEMEKVDQLFQEESDDRHTDIPDLTSSFSGNVDLNSFIIGDDDFLSASKTTSEDAEKYLVKELGKEFEDKDYFKEINEFDFLSLEKMPVKNQNRVLRNEYLEIRGKLSEFNDEMNEKNRKLRTFSIESEQLKKQHKVMKDTIRLIASMLPDGSDLKHKLDTNNWVIEDVQDSLVESLHFVTNRVRNAEEYVKKELGGMEENILKYKKVLAMQENEKNLLSQELDTKNETVAELNKKILSLDSKISDLELQLKNASYKKKEENEVKETEEERIRREKLELLRKKEKELEELKKQLESPVFNDLKSINNLTEDVPFLHENNNSDSPQITEENKPVEENYIDKSVIEIDKKNDANNHFNYNESETDGNKEEIVEEEEPIEEIEEMEEEWEEEIVEEEPETTVSEPSIDPDSEDFDIDAILERKLKIRHDDSPSPKDNSLNEEKNTPKNEKLETVQDDIVIPANIEDHIRVLNDKRIFIIRIIGDYGFSRNQEISDFIEKDPEGIRIFSSKGKFQKQEVTNMTRGLADSEYLSSQRVDMGGRGGHNFKVYELSNIGKAIYKHLFKKIPVIPESQLLVKQHASLEHGYLIKETIIEFQNMGYKVYTSHKDCRFDLPNGDHKIFDLVIEKEGKKQMIEVERGTHNDKDFFKAMDKIYEITKDFYFVCPNDTVWFDKTRRQWYLWMKKEKGGSQDPRIAGVVTLSFTTLNTLKKEPKPKSVWKPIKF